MAVSAPTATFSETINHTLKSAPEQAERPEIHHCILPPPQSIPLAILEMLLPNYADVKILEKRHQPESICPKYVFGKPCIAVPYQKVTTSAWTRR